jgi:hypothetical protein
LPPTQYAQEPVRQQQPRLAQWQQPQDTPPSAQKPQPQWQPTPPAQQPPAGGQWGAPPAQQPPSGRQWGTPGAPPRLRRPGQRRTRRWVMAVFTVVVLLVLLVIGDRVANAITENAFASQFQSQGVPVKPSVNIEGFPFLTQLAAKDFNKIDISASNIPVQIPETGGTLTITSVHATVNGLHISGYSTSANAKVDHITATVFVSFGSLAAAGSLGGTGVTLTQAGPNTVKITAGVAGLSDSEEATITQTGPQEITIAIKDTGGLGGILGSIGFNSFKFDLPKVVPASLRITAVTLNSQGLTVSAAASNAVFTQGK